MTTEPLTESLRETLDVFAADHAPLTTTEVAERLGLGRRSAYERLDRLAERGALGTKKVGSSGRVWWRPSRAASDARDGGSADGERGGRTPTRDRAQFESLVEAVEEYAIFLLDTAGHVRTWNPGAARIKGYETSEIIGEHFSTFYTETDREEGVPEANLRRAAEDGSVEDEGWRVRADGTRFWANVTITAVYDDDGDLQGFAKVTRDMTERREYEQRLEEQAERLERQRDHMESELDGVFERIDDAFFAVDDDWRITYVNDSAAELVRLPASELVGASVWEKLPEVADGYPRAMAERAMATQESTEFDFYSEMLDIWVDVRLYPAEDGLSVYFRDVTEHKERERELEQYETIVETIRDGVYVLDDDFRFTMVNDAYAEMTGYDREELLGEHCSLVVGDDVSAASAERVEEILAGAGETGTLEADVHRADGTRLRAESRFTAIPGRDDRGPKKVGVVRDVSERVARERELEESRRRYQTLVENFPNGAVALVDEDLHYVTVGGTPVREADATTEVLEGEPVRDRLPDEVANVVAPRYEAALDGESSKVVHELGEAVYEFRFVPVRDDEGEVFAAMGMSQDVTDRVEYERELERQREQLAAVNNVNEVVNGITEAVVEQSTREEIEETVCEYLAAADSYLFAWIGDVDVGSQTVNLRTEAGVEGYLDDITITVDPDDERSQGPTGRAFQTGEIQTTQDIRADDRHDPWRDKVEQYGIRSSAAIPIVHEGTIYGVLNVYAGRPNAFEGKERSVLGQLGEVVGHAIAAAERKRALMNDEVVELEFHIPDVLAAIGVDGEPDGVVTLDHAIPLGDDDYLLYGTATADGVETVRAAVEALPHWNEVTFHGEEDVTFEIRLSEPPVLSVLASQGGSVERAVVEDGDFEMTLFAPPGKDVRTIIDTVQEYYPAAQLQKRRQVTRPEGISPSSEDQLLGDLTDRQRAAVEAAHHAGFFEWPRDASGEEVAESLGVSPPTFHQHLRKAEEKVFDTLLSSPTAEA